VGLVFAVSRLFALLVPSPMTDVGTYARYTREHEAASRLGEDFYAYHVRTVNEETDRLRAEGRLAGSLEEYKDVEYPPLAVAFMRLPALAMRHSADELSAKEYDLEYWAVYRRAMAVVDGLLVVLIGWLARRLYPAEPPGEWVLRMLFYLAGTTALWILLYDRLDLVQALLVLLALALLIGRRHYAWSFAVLAVAVNFKLVPLVLAPAWVVGSLPAERPFAPWRPRQAGELVVRSALLVVMVLAIFLPLYALYGSGTLAFFRYHGSRGLEIESLWSCVPLALRSFGQAIAADYSYGSVNIRTALTPLLTRLALPVTALLLVLTTSLLLLRARRLTAANMQRPTGKTLAQLYPAEFVCYALLLLMAFVCANKVFSPQYLLWLAPLVVLVPLVGRARRVFLWAFLLICVLSPVIAPLLFVVDLLDHEAKIVPPVIRDPTPRLVALILARNLLFLGWVAGFAAFLARRAFAAAEPSAGPEPQKGAARAR
jgi:hypothetical protein